MMRNRGSNSVQFLGTKKGADQTCNNMYPRGSIRKIGYTGWGKFPGECCDTAEWKHGPSEKRCSLPPGWWYLCANGKAWKRLPQNWWGECTTGILLPISYPTRNLQGVSRTLWYQIKQKRQVENPLVIRGTRFHSFVRWLIPMLGVSELEKAIVNISATVEILANATADAIANLQKEINSLAEVTIQNRMALDLLMAKEGGVCTVINQSCCAFVNREAQIETDVHRIWEASKLFHLIAQDDTSWGFTNLWEKLTSWLPNFAWLKQLFVLVVTLLILGVITCVLIKSHALLLPMSGHYKNGFTPVWVLCIIQCNSMSVVSGVGHVKMYMRRSSVCCCIRAVQKRLFSNKGCVQWKFVRNVYSKRMMMWVEYWLDYQAQRVVDESKPSQEALAFGLSQGSAELLQAGVDPDNLCRSLLSYIVTV
ncbi:uncharacterized protein LOC141933995 [Strix aluco]|uniref:uncharacterized protein LOC141933995 n=1 Tax=Strix aluco TaxID=111821 RepID=UPI003DA47203